MLKEFRDFIIKGNTLELAIGVILALSFGAVVTALTEGVLMALIAAMFGKADFESLSVSLNGTPIMYGRVITALVNLALVGLVLFAIVKAVNRLKAPKKVPALPDETDHDLLAQIRDELRRRPALNA